MRSCTRPEGSCNFDIFFRKSFAVLMCPVCPVWFNYTYHSSTYHSVTAEWRVHDHLFSSTLSLFLLNNDMFIFCPILSLYLSYIKILSVNVLNVYNSSFSFFLNSVHAGRWTFSSIKWYIDPPVSFTCLNACFMHVFHAYLRVSCMFECRNSIWDCLIWWHQVRVLNVSAIDSLRSTTSAARRHGRFITRMSAY